VLFHTAAYFREYFSGGDHWPKLKALNIDATIALLEEAERRGVKKVIYTSSSGVIGRHRTAAPPTKRCHPTHIPLKTSISKARCWPKKPLLTS
jgi:dihydroflavonol-4-reductase